MGKKRMGRPPKSDVPTDRYSVRLPVTMIAALKDRSRIPDPRAFVEATLRAALGQSAEPTTQA